MKDENPRYVVWLPGKGGKKERWFKRRGWKSRKFKNQELGPAFYAEYTTILNGVAPQPKAFLIHGLIDAYYRSTKFTTLKPRTQQDYIKFLNRLDANAAKVAVRSIERKHAIAWRDQLAVAETPHYANYFTRVLSVLLEYAIDIGELTENPAKGIKAVKYEKQAREPWPKHLIEAARKARLPRDRTRLLFELLYCSGQRVGDVLQMKWTDIRGNSLCVSQNKTGAALVIPITDDLQACLRHAERRGETILTAHRKDTPWSYRGAAGAMMKLRREIGAENYDIHAIRHTVASELGAVTDDDEGMSITGHATKAMFAHYAGKARQIERAKKAQKKRK